MHNLLPTLLPRIEAHRLPGLDCGPEAMYPFYGGLSLANMPSSICHWLDVPGLGSQPFSEEILSQYKTDLQNVILLVVNNMGLNTLQQALAWTEDDADFAV